MNIEASNIPGKMKNSRRDFLRHSGVLSAGIFIFPRCISNKVASSIPLELIKDGESDYVVVLNSGSGEAEAHAADQLVHYIEQSSGGPFNGTKGPDGR